MNCGQLPARLLPTRPNGDRPERMSGRTTCRNTPSHIMPPARSQPGSSAEVSLASADTTTSHHAPTPRPGLPVVIHPGHGSAGIPAGGRPPHAHNLHPAEALTQTGLTHPHGTSNQARAGGRVSVLTRHGAPVTRCLRRRPGRSSLLRRWRALMRRRAAVRGNGAGSDRGRAHGGA